MSERPRHTCLKALRKICGLNQERFAKKIGVSKGAIVAIEVGTLQMSLSMAKRISRAFAVDVMSLLKPDGVPHLAVLRDNAGGPYPLTPELYREFREQKSEIADEVFFDPVPQEYTQSRVFERLLFAARTRGVSRIVTGEFYDWVAEMLMAFPAIGSEFFTVSSNFEDDDLRRAVLPIALRLAVIERQPSNKLYDYIDGVALPGIRYLMRLAEHLQGSKALDAAETAKGIREVLQALASKLHATGNAAEMLVRFFKPQPSPRPSPKRPQKATASKKRRRPSASRASDSSRKAD